MTQPPNSPTADQSPTASQSPAHARPPLRRSRDERVLAGVCAGVAQYLGVDPILVRVVIVVLTLFGGGGLFLYLLGWFLIPDQGRTQSPAQQLFGSGSTTSVVVAAVCVATLAIVLVSGGFWWGGLWPHYGPPGFLLLAGAVALVIWLVRRNNEPLSPTSTSASTTHSEVTAMTSSSDQSTKVLEQPTQVLEQRTQVLDQPTSPPNQPPYYGTAEYQPDPQPPAPPKPKKPRSVLGLLTLSIAALVAGILITVDLANGGNPITATTVLAASLAVVALGLLIGTFFGRSRGLIVLGIILSLATAATSALSSLDVSGGIGQRTWRPTTTAEALTDYHLGVGNAILDLRDLPVSEIPSQPITASLGVGQLRVFLPTNVDVNVTSDVSLGQVDVDGEQAPQTTGNVVHTTIDVPNERATIDLDLKVGVGEIDVNPSGPVVHSIHRNANNNPAKNNQKSGQGANQ